MSHLHTLKQISQTLNAENDLKRMLDNVLHTLLAELDFSSGWIFLIDQMGNHTLYAASGIPPGLSRKNCTPLKEGGCWCKNQFLHGTLERAVNMIECQRLERAIERGWGETNGITHHATVPIYAGEEPLGILNVAHPQKHHYAQDELELLELIALQIGTAIKRVELVAFEAEQAELNERQRLSQDLHDSVNQLLFSVNMTLQGMAIRTKDEEMKEKMSDVSKLVSAALGELRAIIRGHSGEELEAGLAQAVEQYSRLIGISVRLLLPTEVDWPAKTELATYRIIQEALNNCKKHAGVKEATISLTKAQGEWLLTISDQGEGFETNHVSRKQGLDSIRKRAKELGGQALLISAPGSGTTWEIRFPDKKGEKE